jgi:hypothetical protein
MNWNTQYEDMMKTWTDSQKKVWEGYFETMQGLNKPQSARMWESTLTMGEDMFKELLKTQAQGMATWVEGLSKMEGVPPQAIESARQYQEMTERWNKTQAELLENWFAMMKKVTPAANPAEAWTGMPQTMFKPWQDSVQTIMDAQSKWMNTWMEQAKKSNE